MRRTLRKEDGFYHVNGEKYGILEGSRAQVGHETAYRTSGGLTKKDLIQNKGGLWVSALKSRTAKKEKRLEKHGYFAKKGSFGWVRKDKSRKNKKSRKH